MAGVFNWPNGRRVNFKKHANHHETSSKFNLSVKYPQRYGLDNIPDDCLFHVYQYLSPLDIANVSEASKVLYDFAKANHIYKRFTDYGIFESGVWNFSQFQCIVRYFGENFKHITLDSRHIVGDPVYNVSLVLRHCKHLEELRLINIKLGKDAVNVLRKERCTINRMFIKTCVRDIHLRSLLTMWPQIRDLSVHCTGMNQLPLQIAGGVNVLERLSLANARINGDHFTIFMQNHAKSLRNLSLININWTAKNAYESIRKVLPELEQLQISVTSSMDTMFIADMNLKYLQLVGTANIHMIFPLMSLLQLEELSLVHMRGQTFFAAANIRNLRVIRFYDMNLFDYPGMIDIIESLPNLQCLYMESCIFDCCDLEYLIYSSKILTQIEITYPNSTSGVDSVTTIVEYLLEYKNQYRNSNTPVELRFIVNKFDVRIILYAM